MHRKKIMLWVAAFVLTLPLFMVGNASAAIDGGYVGTAACAVCHTSQAADHAQSGHPYKYTHTGGAVPTGLPSLFPRIKGLDVDTLTLGEDCGNGLVVCDGDGSVSWSAINYTVGGFGWKIRWGIKDTIMTGGSTSTGYLWTSTAGDGGGTKAQYNLRDGSWSDYNGGKDKKYECAICHNTNGIVSTSGYACSTPGGTNASPARTQPWASNPGMGPETKGGYYSSWTFDGVQCEACHGPGQTHAEAIDPALVTIGTLSTAPGIDVCAKCHIRAENAAGQSAECDGTLFSGITASSPLNNGAKFTEPFIGHHEQYNELAGLNGDGVHSSLNCTSCHNPHKRATTVISSVAALIGITDNDQSAQARGAVVSCESCHGVKPAKYNMGNTSCVDCHMGEATKSASAKPTTSWGRKGDVKTHIFKINPTATTMGRSNGFTNIAQNYITPRYACGKCHDSVVGGNATQLTEAAAQSAAAGMHTKSSYNHLRGMSNLPNACGDCHTSNNGVVSYDIADIVTKCDDCHGGGTSIPTPYTGVGPYKTTAILTAMAKNMHGTDEAPVVNSSWIYDTTDAKAMSVIVTDASTGADGIANAVKVNWGDGTISTGVSGGVFTHTYTRAKTYTVAHSVYDGLKGDSEIFKVTVPKTISISGSVTGIAAGNGGVTLILKYNGHTKKRVKTASDGSFTFSGIRPITSGAYSISAYKYHVKFTNPTTVGAPTSDVTGVSITGTEW